MGNINKVKLQGTITSEVVLEEELKMGEKIYTFSLTVPRESGAEDVLIIRASNRITSFDCLTEGAVIEVTGDIRTYRYIDGERRRLRLTVFAKSVSAIDKIITSDNNECEISGVVGKQPILRKAKTSDRVLCEVQVKVQRQQNKISIIPVIVWGRDSEYASRFEVGDNISVSGRLQSRNIIRHNGDGDDVESSITYEVSATGITKVEEESIED